MFTKISAMFLIAFLFFADKIYALESNSVDYGDTSYSAVNSSESDQDSVIYGIHSDDKLNIQVYHEADLSGIFTVNSAGKINYPMIGDIYVEGLLLDEFQRFLVDSLGKGYIVNPQVQVTFQESPNKSISILGEVQKPGAYILTPNLTLVKLHAQVGGFTASAAKDRVRLVRTDKTGKHDSHLLDVDKILSGEAADVKLKPGDMIIVDKLRSEKEAVVDTKNNVTILGQVGRSGNYSLSNHTTLIRLIAEAGGFTPVASTSNVKIVRQSVLGNKNSLSVDAGKIMDGRKEDVELQPGDIIVVSEGMF